MSRLHNVGRRQFHATLASWGAAHVVVQRGGLSLTTRLSARPAYRWAFEPDGELAPSQRARFFVSQHAVEAREPDGETTRIVRLLLPPELENALHVGPPALRTVFGLRNISGLRRPAPFQQDSRAEADEDAVVLWVERGARSRFWVWWVCSAFARARRIAVVPIHAGLSDVEWESNLSNARELCEASSRLRVLTAPERLAFARNWARWWAGRWPKDLALSTWPADARWVGQVPRSFSEALPIGGALSVFDRRLLEAIPSDRFATSLKVLMAALRKHDHAMLWGDWTFEKRLAQWARWKAGRYVERRRSTGVNRLTRWEQRLTVDGKALLTAPRVNAPPHGFGGFDARAIRHLK